MIVDLLRKEGLDVEVSGVSRLLKKYRETGGTIDRRPGQLNSKFVQWIVNGICELEITSFLASGRPTKITHDTLRIVEAQMRKDDETTAVQLQKVLPDKGHPLSLKTIPTSRSKLGWTFLQQCLLPSYSAGKQGKTTNLGSEPSSGSP